MTRSRACAPSGSSPRVRGTRVWSPRVVRPLAHSGGNFTGVSTLGTELDSKLREILNNQTLVLIVRAFTPGGRAQNYNCGHKRAAASGIFRVGIPDIIIRRPRDGHISAGHSSRARNKYSQDGRAAKLCARRNRSGGQLGPLRRLRCPEARCPLLAEPSHREIRLSCLSRIGPTNRFSP